MNDPGNIKNELLAEIVNRHNMGDKKFHSETSLQQFGEDEEANSSDAPNMDPGVLNKSINNPRSDENPAKRRTMSQPGPAAGNFKTATAARAARRRPQKNVMYASDLEKIEPIDKQPSKYMFPKGDNSGTVTPIAELGSPLSSNGNYRNGDIKSLNNLRIYASNSDVRNITPRKRSVTTIDAQSIRSVDTMHAPPPTNPDENKRLTSQYLTLILSCMYAILLVTLGLIIYLADPFLDISLSSIYSLILSSIGFLYHIYLIYDITRYKSTALKNENLKQIHVTKVTEYFRKQEDEYTSNSADRNSDIYRVPVVPPAVLIPLKHDYCFSQGRHSGSFYLKMGAAGFALGHLVHSILLITVQIGYMVDENIDNNHCVDILQVCVDFLNPFYCFLQLYFIFKYSNVIILRAQGLARFTFMHMIGSSLCFWINAIVRETLLALTLYANSIYGGDNYDKNETATTESTPNAVITRLNVNTAQLSFLDVSKLYNEECIGSVTMSSVYENISPYLYPFTVEFNILIVAVYYIIWSNIGNCDNDESMSDTNSSSEDNTTLCRIPTANEDNDFTSNIVIHADCHASTRGLFLGLIVLVIIVGMLIIGFVFSSVGEDFLEVGYILGDSTKLALHIAMLFAAVAAYNQLKKLDINEHPISLLDDILLFICLPAFFMETVFSLTATLNILNVVKSVDYIVMVTQVIIQSALLIDGLRRCSNTKKLRRTKPGRELVMFLIITNVGMWIFNTFSYKSPESLDERYAYYGKVMWTVLGHVSLPLIMFYRFHSSVCFADIWDSAYKPGSEH